MWQMFFLVSTLDFLNCFMITISWYWPWNNKIRKTIIWVFLCLVWFLKHEGSHFWDFSFQPHQEFSPTKDKNKSETLCCLKKKITTNCFLNSNKNDHESHIIITEVGCIDFPGLGALLQACKSQASTNLSVIDMERHWASRALLNNS